MENVFGPSSNGHQADDQEREVDTDGGQVLDGLEQEEGPGLEPEEGSDLELEEGSDLEPEEGSDLELEEGSDLELDLEGPVPELELEGVVARMEMLQGDVSQMASSLDSIRISLSSVVFLLLFIWVERKMKNIVMKISGGKKNASID